MVGKQKRRALKRITARLESARRPSVGVAGKQHKPRYVPTDVDSILFLLGGMTPQQARKRWTPKQRKVMLKELRDAMKVQKRALAENRDTSYLSMVKQSMKRIDRAMSVLSGKEMGSGAMKKKSGVKLKIVASKKGGKIDDKDAPQWLKDKIKKKTKSKAGVKLKIESNTITARDLRKIRFKKKQPAAKNADQFYGVLLDVNNELQDFLDNKLDDKKGGMWRSLVDDKQGPMHEIAKDAESSLQEMVSTLHKWWGSKKGWIFKRLRDLEDFAIPDLQSASSNLRRDVRALRSLLNKRNQREQGKRRDLKMLLMRYDRTFAGLLAELEYYTRPEMGAQMKEKSGVKLEIVASGGKRGERAAWWNPLKLFRRRKVKPFKIKLQPALHKKHKNVSLAIKELGRLLSEWDTLPLIERHRIVLNGEDELNEYSGMLLKLRRELDKDLERLEPV